MKTQILKTGNIVMTLMTIITMTFSTVSFASGNNEKTAELIVKTSDKDRPVLQLRLNNTQDDVYFIRISDSEANTVFAETLKGKNLARDYKFDLDATELDNMHFTITSKKTNKNIVYKLTNNTRVVHDVNVSEL